MQADTADGGSWWHLHPPPADAVPTSTNYRYLAARTGHGASDEAVRLALRRADYVCKRSGWTLKRKAEEQPGWAGNG